MLYEVKVKKKWTHNNGFCLDEGTTVELTSSKSSPVNLLMGGMQEISNAFKRKYGIVIPIAIRNYASDYLLVTLLDSQL